MSGLKDAPDEKKARTRPLKLFNTAITALEEQLEGSLLDEEVETALKMVLAAYTTVYDLHRAYLAARQPDSGEEEIEDDPADVKWMDKVKQNRVEVLRKYRDWKKGQAAEVAEVTAAREKEKLQKDREEELQKCQKDREDKLKQQIEKLEAEIVCVGDPEKEVSEVLGRDVTVDGIRK